MGRRLEPSAYGRWDTALDALVRSHDREGFLEAFAAIGRRLGRAVPALESAERAALAQATLTWTREEWGLDGLGRVAMLTTVAAHWKASELEALLEEAYSRGDLRERQAVLRALPLLPGPERFLPLAVDACRTHVQPVFEAIACENPYPARHFPDLNFNQLVLKALFVGVTLDRLVGLTARVTPELRRMAADYASERRAAGRPVPPDIGRLLGQEGDPP